MPYMMLLFFMPLLSLATAQAAETENPFLGLPHSELTQMLTDLAPVVEQNWYRVEVLVFARNDARSNEVWRVSEEPEPDANALRLLLAPAHLTPGSNETDVAPMQASETESLLETPYPEAIAAGGWQLIAADERRFARHRERMLASGHYRVLFHQAWHQPVFAVGESRPLLIEGGGTFERPLPAPPAFHTDDDSAIEAFEFPNDGSLPMSDTAWKPHEYPELQGSLTFSLARFLHVEARLWLTSITPEGTLFFAPLKQSRRMRSEETHYLDHPLFGVIVRIDPWDHPEQEKAALIQQALELPEPAQPEIPEDNAAITR